MRVLIADDELIVREGLRTLIAAHGHHVVGMAADGAEALAKLPRVRADVVVLDLRMPPEFRLEGFETAAAIHREHPGIGAVVLSQFLEPDYPVALLEACPSHVGYVLKADIGSGERLMDAIEAASRGGTYIDDGVVSRLARGPHAAQRLADLSAREVQLLELVASGRSNRGISAMVNLSERTVEAHLASMIRKLGLDHDATTNRRVAASLLYLAGREPLAVTRPAWADTSASNAE